MKKMNFASITAGLDTLKDVMQQNAEIAQDKLIDVSFIDFAPQNTFAADDTDESIRELADSIELLGLLEPLVVVRDNDRYTLIAGERRYRAITQCLHWSTVPCRVFDGEALSRNRKQLMLHEANGQRDLSAGRQLQIFEEYNALLEEMMQNGEYTGTKLGLIAKKMQISDRQVRKYKRIAEQLTQQEKEMLAAGELTVNEASRLAVARSKKSGTEFRFWGTAGGTIGTEFRFRGAAGGTTGTEFRFRGAGGSTTGTEFRFRGAAGGRTGTEFRFYRRSGAVQDAGST